MAGTKPKGKGQQRSKTDHSAADDKPNSLTAKAYSDISKRIIRLELEPGQTFTEGELAAELELSKTPVREALLLLGVFGFVIPRPRSGYRVAPITLKDARDLFAAFRVVGPEIAALVAELGVDERMGLHLQDLAEHTVDRTDAADVDAFIDEELDLFHHLAAECKSPRLQRMTGPILVDLARLVRLMIRLDRRFVFDPVHHLKLVEAIEGRDAKAARSATVKIVDRWESAVVQALLESDAVQVVNLAAALER